MNGKNAHCENCIFASDDLDSSTYNYVCRRFPPVIDPNYNESYASIFPGVHDDDFCGEFIPKEAE